MFSAPPNQHITLAGGHVFTFGLIKICSLFVTNTNTKHNYSKANKRTPKTSQDTQKHPKSTPVRPNCSGVSRFSPFKGIKNRSKAKTTANEWKNTKHDYSKAKKRTPKTSQETQKHPKSTPVRPNCSGVSCFSPFKGLINRSKAKTTANDWKNPKHHYSKAKKRTPKTSQEIQKHPKSTPVRPNCSGVLCFSPFKNIKNR